VPKLTTVPGLPWDRMPSAPPSTKPALEPLGPIVTLPPALSWMAPVPLAVALLLIVP
jgi:hypothetical protein